MFNPFNYAKGLCIHCGEVRETEAMFCNDCLTNRSFPLQEKENSKLVGNYFDRLVLLEQKIESYSNTIYELQVLYGNLVSKLERFEKMLKDNGWEIKEYDG